MEMVNFFRIYGEKEIIFAVDNDKNVTVIKGENGMGKTTLLSAFNWAFYGDVILPLTIEEMLNKRARIEMKTGEIKKASVSVEITDRKREYTFQRSLIFKKDHNGVVKPAGEPETYIINKTENKVIKDSQFFENLIPSELRGFFFFDGERIDRLAKIDGKKEIKKAILDILGLTSLEQINENLESVKKDFNSEMKKKAKDQGLKDLNEQFELISAKLDLEKITEKEENKKLAKAKQIKQECDKYLEEHNADKVRLLQKERDKLENEKISIEGETGKIRTEQKNILTYISKNFKLYLISRYFQEINNLLEDKRQKKELPSDIKETFIKDLLDSKVCICGRPIFEYTQEHKNVLELLKTAGHQELDNAYIKINAFINSNANNEIIENFYKEIYAYKDTIMMLEERTEEIKKELERISNELKNNNDEMIAVKEAQREKAEQEIEGALKNLGKAENNIGIYVEQLKVLTGKIQKATGKDKEANILAKCFEMADELLQLNEEIRGHFIKTTQEDMDAKLKQVFQSLSRKQEREPVLTKDFELIIVNKDTKAPQILSTGEGQITSLSFIGALVSYAKEKPNMQLISDFAGGDYPIVMDSPFGNLDLIHKSNIAAGIPTLASQVIVIVSSSQWKGEVEANIFNRVGKIYELIDGQTNEADSEFTELKEVK